MALKRTHGIPLNLTDNPRMGLTDIIWQKQAGGSWCWAACISMVRQGLKSPLGQCEVAGKVLKGKCATTPCSQYNLAHEDCGKAAYPIKDIKDLWSKFKIKVDPVTSAVDWSIVWDELKAGNPLEIFLGVSNEKGEAGHLVLLIDVTVDSTGKQMVLVADPATDTHEFSPKDFDSLRERLHWGPWAWTWTFDIN